MSIYKNNLKLNILLIIISLFLSISSTSICIGANETKENWPKNPSINGKSAILMDAESGAILYQKKPNKKMYPASITKILTALVTLDTQKLKTKVTFSHKAVYSLQYGDAHIAIDEGEKVPVKGCLYGLMLASANEVANGLAEHISGSNEEFGKLMTAYAKNAGALNSNFTNPSGLHNDNHYTTSYDMAMITREALNNETFIEITGTNTYYIAKTNLCDEKRPVNNKHKMLWEANSDYYEAVIGGKTGYTEQAGNTLVTYAKKDGMTLICVVLDSANGHIYDDTASLLDYGFENFSVLNVNEERPEEINNNNVEFKIAENSTIVIPKSLKATELTTSIADVDTNYNIGDSTTLNYHYNKHFLGSCPLICTSVPVTATIGEIRTTPKSTTRSGLHPILTVIIFIICTIIAFLGAIILRLKYVEKQRKLQRERRLKFRNNDYNYER